MIDIFMSAKQVEGCSERIIKYYKEIIDRFIKEHNKSIKYIVTEDIRSYLAKYKELGGTMPEDLPIPEKSLKQLEKENKRKLEKR